jgi:hypothetical protein
MVAIAKRLAETRGGMPFVLFIALLMGGAVAFVCVAMPAPLFERLVVMSGLPNILAAAAPPLGFTARALLASVAGIAAFAATFFSLRMIGGPARAPGEKTPNERIFRQPPAEPLLREKPRLRRADSHPDAPSRRPIFASADLGETFDTLGSSRRELRLDPYEMRLSHVIEPDPLPESDWADLGAPLSRDWADDAEPLELDEPVDDRAPHSADDFAAPAESEPELPVEPMAFEPAPAPIETAAAPEVAAPEPVRVAEPRPDPRDESIDGLMARFEAGLARRTAGRVSAVAAPAPVSRIAPEAPAEDMDGALRDALDQLRRMTSRG